MTIIDVYCPFIETFNQVGMNESFVDKESILNILILSYCKNLEFKFDSLIKNFD